MHYAAVCDDFEFTGDHSRTERAPEKVADGASVVRADQLLERSRILAGRTEDFRGSRIGAENVAVGIEREHSGWNVFKHRFHQLAAAF